MKSIGLLLVILFVLAGCNNPVEVTQEELYTESIMMDISDAPEGVRDVDTPTGPGRKFARMMLSLKRFVGLSEEQWTSVKGFARVLANEVKTVRESFKNGDLSREEAFEQLRTARRTFVGSVKSILTDDQVPLFERWLRRVWYATHNN